MASVTVVLLGLLPTATVEGQGKGLFSAVEPVAARTRTPASASTGATTHRRRLVAIDFGMLSRARAAASRRQKPGSARRRIPPATLTLNLFQDVVLTGIVERTEPTFSGGYSVSGRLAGEPLGTMTLVVNGETVAGAVRTLRGTYRIRSAGRGRYAISQVEEPPLNCGVEEPRSETDHEH